MWPARTHLRQLRPLAELGLQGGEIAVRDGVGGGLEGGVEGRGWQRGQCLCIGRGQQTCRFALVEADGDGQRGLAAEVDGLGIGAVR